MTRKILHSLVVAVFFVTLAGAAAADYSDYSMEESWQDRPAEVQPTVNPADPESIVGQVDLWQAREPVETGALPARPEGSSGSPCCTSGEGLTFEQDGSAKIRPGIDDGP
jgi:hypothetical protein